MKFKIKSTIQYYYIQNIWYIPDFFSIFIFFFVIMTDNYLEGEIKIEEIRISCFTVFRVLSKKFLANNREYISILHNITNIEIRISKSSFHVILSLKYFFVRCSTDGTHTNAYIVIRIFVPNIQKFSYLKIFPSVNFHLISLS